MIKYANCVCSGLLEIKSKHYITVKTHRPLLQSHRVNCKLLWRVSQTVSQLEAFSSFQSGQHEVQFVYPTVTVRQIAGLIRKNSHPLGKAAHYTGWLFSLYFLLDHQLILC